jgi:phosphatidylinositol glycan class Z
MYILRWLWEGFGYEVSPSVVYWALRVLMLTLSIVMEDWAIHELVDSPRARRVAVPLVASSYVTWTFQTHTFSNSLETLLVCWSLVLIQRIVGDKVRHPRSAPANMQLTQAAEELRHLGLVHVRLYGRGGSLQSHHVSCVPAPSLAASVATLQAQVSVSFPSLYNTVTNIYRPLSFIFLTLSVLFAAFIAVCVDTASYTPGEFTFSRVFNAPIITPLNNFIYNSDSTNLAQHGIHPRYQHFLINLPQLLGPAFPLLFFLRRSHISPILVSALSGVLLLSIFPHQEARFLLPAVPLILSSIRLPYNPALRKTWTATWVIFNVVLGMLMGVYHQGGIVPVQMNMAKTNETITHAFWWKTYSPPTWLLNGKNEELTTHDLMGMPAPQMLDAVSAALPTCRTRHPPKIEGRGAVYLVAPRSAYFLKPFQDSVSSATSSLASRKARRESKRGDISLQEVWSYRQHLNLDDMDFGDDGVWPTLSRVVGDRGLVAWRVTRNCWATGPSAPA